MKIINLLTAVFVSLLFFQCPYSSTVPIDKPGMEIDKKLLGKWQKSPSDMNYIEVTAKSKNEYTIRQCTYDTIKKEYNKTEYTAHLAKIEGALFLNIKDDSGKYFFYKLDIEKDTLKALSVTSNITEVFSKSDSLKDFFKKHMKLSFFYNQPAETFTKSK